MEGMRSGMGGAWSSNKDTKYKSGRAAQSLSPWIQHRGSKATVRTKAMKLQWQWDSVRANVAGAQEQGCQVDSRVLGKLICLASTRQYATC